MPNIAAGVVRFQSEIYPKHRELFERLATGQSPEALFITCADSRIDPAMVTASQPGDIFVLRNAGNIVPPHEETASGMTASIEFAVAALKVRHIVVCGHTECGAMKGATDMNGLDGLPRVRDWLAHSAEAVETVRGRGEDPASPEGMTALLRENVLLQLAHLRSHPTVAAGLENGSLTLHGWVYDIRSGAVEAHDESTGAFLPVETRYADAIAAQAAAHTHAH